MEKGDLFFKEYWEASEALSAKGYYVDNMVYFPDEYEVSTCSNKPGTRPKTVMAHLSLAQLIDLANLLTGSKISFPS